MHPRAGYHARSRPRITRPDLCFRPRPPMPTSLLPLLLLPSPSDPAIREVASVQTPPPQQGDPEFERRKKEAGNDVDKLWDVYKWCKDKKKDPEGRQILRAILKLEPD